MTRLYLWGHRHLPRLLDCRPIPVADLLTATGWPVHAVRHLPSMGLPMSATLATVTARGTNLGNGMPGPPAGEQTNR